MGASIHIVQNQGIYHALPTFSNSVRSLTALVMGANGISGYHMVKVLAAAPERWKKIYCLSRGSLPDYFFSDLGQGADRAEHTTMDFLTDVETIAKQLDKIDHVDHVFFFSYMQPEGEKGGVSSMCSDADASVNVNVKLLRNFP